MAPPGLNIDGAIQDLKRYFERPVQLVTPGQYNSLSRAPINGVQIGTAFFGSIGWVQLPFLSLTYGLRYTMNFRLEVAADPFSAGILRMFWWPSAPTFPVGVGNPDYPRHNYAQFVCQLPGVNLNLQDQTSATLAVPWVSNRNMHLTPIQAREYYPTGYLGLYAYTPIAQASGASPPTYSIWGHLTDITFVGTSGDPAPFTAQAGSREVVSKEQHDSNSAIDQVGAGLTMVARNIPSLMSMWSRPSVILRAASNAAAAFGWAKPLQVAPLMRNLPSWSLFEHCADGPDSSVPLGNFVDTHLSVLPGFAGSTVDEMSIAFISQQWGLLANILLGSDAVGVYKFGALLAPQYMWYSGLKQASTLVPTAGSSVNMKTVFTTPIFQLGNSFAAWRGSFRFRFLAAKTKYHSGRLIVGFVPYAGFDVGTSPIGPTNTTSLLDYSAVWDLRERTTFEFSTSFIAQSKFMPCQGDACAGSLYVRVLDPMRCPATVSQTIPIVIEVCGGPDFEFIMPIPPVCQHAGFTLPLPLVAQSGGTTYTTSHSSDNETCSGEVFRSIKQLLSMGQVCQCVNANSAGSTYNQLPTLTSLGRDTYAGSPIVITYADRTHIGHWGPSYLLCRGSLNYHAYSKCVGSTSSIKIFRRRMAYATATADTWTSQPITVPAFTFAAGQGLVAAHCRSPYVSLMPSTFYQQVDQIDYPYDNGLSNDTFVTYAASSVYSYMTTVAAGDDVQFGYWLGSSPVNTQAVGTSFNAAIDPLSTAANVWMTS